MAAGITKVIYSGALPDGLDASMRIIEDRQGFAKLAADGAGLFDYDAVSPDKDHVGIHLIALGDFEHYGCFFAGAPVQTLTGQKPIEEVQEGELVLTHRNRYRPVLHKFESAYDGIRVALTCADLPDPVVSTANHPWLVVRAEKLTSRIRFNSRRDGELERYIDQLVVEAELVSADQIRPGDYMIVPCSPEVPEAMALPDSADPYVLGLYVAEGCLVKEYKNISTKGEYKNILFTLSQTDERPIEYLQDWFVKQGREPVAACPSYTSEFGVRLEYGLKELAGPLDTLFGHTVASKHVHPAIFAQSREFKLKFLAGYFDGDGCQEDNSDRPRYLGTLKASTVSRTLALDLQRLCASVGVVMSVSRCHNYERHRHVEGFGKGRGDLPIFALTVGARGSNAILEHCLRLASHGKAMKFGGSPAHTSGRYLLVPVRKVEVDLVENEVKYNLEVADDNTYVVDVQGHNSNRNGDSFPKTACINYHDTFVKHGHVFRHHKNKDPQAALGAIKLSAYNAPMGRIELFIHAHKEKCAEELTKLERAGEIPFSMATYVPWDRCSRCQTLRKSSADPNQCDHVRYELGKVAEDGTITCTHNDEPRFFDISFVFRPADRIAWNLKTASDGLLDSVKLASEFDELWLPERVAILSPVSVEKRALLAKLAQMESRLFALAAQPLHQLHGRDRELWELRKAAANRALDDETLTALRDYEPADVLYRLAAENIVLDPESFFKYAMGAEYARVAEHIPAVLASMANGLFDWIEKTGRAVAVCNDAFYDTELVPYRANVGRGNPKSLLTPTIGGGSFADKHASHRAVMATIEGLPARIAKTGETFCAKKAAEAVVNGLAERYASYKLAAVLAMLKLHPNQDADRQLAPMTAQHLINR
jgi:hypothetical protein